MTTKVSFWLVPAEEDRAFFQDLIDSLAREYDAPSFTPHVTIYSGEYAPDESLAELIETATRGVQPFSLSVDRIFYTGEFTKTLFVQFYPSATLSQISETLRSNSKKPSNYALNPHLSLIYQYLNQETQKNLTNSLNLPKSEVFFSEVRAISTPQKVQTREDVEHWQVICVSQLQ